MPHNFNPTTQSTYTTAGFLRQHEAVARTMLKVDLDAMCLFNAWFRYTIHRILTRIAIRTGRIPTVCKSWVWQLSQCNVGPKNRKVVMACAERS